ncbi:VCBS repeat-containing protein [Aureibaculum sp. 2210JD6-5]|uniref:VCBS repeat-containing protein n=1 Tax=Aureibaculum sp. 2210JD6-5 TaxID=3103957 RepID=UPI002AAD1828|nr:VCBS repeat-containing protein [Aureibaculum sp. 2210JD6-5]MDY7396312.1 VCBS repeat-containing protein [Aureibaculum sp. 2210JD6-5]
MNKYVLYIFFFFCLVSCNLDNKSSRHNDMHQLFSVLTENDTGIKFNNLLDETTYMNGFFYEYYYNGAGVATADFNNDGLQDIYFVSNKRANQLYLNKGDLEFQNITNKSNTKGGFGWPTGVTVLDINNDGLMDIYISKSGRISNPEHRKNELLINLGIDEKSLPHFQEKAKEYGLDISSQSSQANFFDYDLDGDLDLFLINHGLDVYNDKQIPFLISQKSKDTGEKLYKNDNGIFKEATLEANITNNRLGFALGCSIGDVNNDGWPDIYISHDYSEKDHLYLNNQDGTFKEVSLQAFGHISNFSMGSDMADVNNDGFLDIMSLDMMAQDNYSQKTSMSGMNTKKFENIVELGLHHQYMYNALQINNGVSYETKTPLFSDIAQLAGVSSTDWSWSPLFIDMNNDGYRDLFISNGIKRDFRNNDFAIYKKKKQEEAIKKGKLDKEAYMKDMFDKLPSRKQKNVFMLNNKDLTFQDIQFKQPTTSSNGAAYADFDNDGDIDIVVNNSDDEALIYRNNSEGFNNFIKIKLEGTKHNKDAIGARVEIKTNNVSQIVENYFSRGFQSAMADNLHFGLGTDEKIDTLIIRWPDGSLQYQYKIKANQTLEISYNPTEKLTKHNLNEQNYLFKDITEISRIKFKHQENIYNDFAAESLIPHKMSQMGPGLSVADVNNDGLDDFYIGGPKDQEGVLYVQTTNGAFKKFITTVFEKDKKHEDTGALFFDADNDGDQDLYVVSGGNEATPNSKYYEDRFYENKGNGHFVKTLNTIPKITTSGLKVTVGDYDNDGDLDLFVGSRVKPMHYGQYAKSFILENQSKNGKIKFVDKTENIAPDLVNYTMVTDALWIDYDKDSILDLLVANEWGTVDFFKNEDNRFVKKTAQLGIASNKGWWYSIVADDIDNDGDTDFIAGNLGLNYKYKASKEAPFYMYLNDFDKNNSEDIVLAYHEDKKVFPLRGRQCSSQQMPFIKEKFKTYDAFGKAELKDVYGEALSKSIQYEATNFASGIFKNNDNTQFQFTPFENEVQISSINKILVEDFDKDGNKDLVLLGNLYASEVETPRNDASYGHYMKGDGKGGFKTIPAQKSGLYIKGDVRNAEIIRIGRKKNGYNAILIARNNDSLKLLTNNSSTLIFVQK